MRVHDKDSYMNVGFFPHETLQGVRTKLSSFIQALIWMFIATAGQAATFTVNSTVDLPLSAGMCNGTGTCTLRAAVQQANGTAGSDTIILPAGNYVLTLVGSGENLAATGDLDITADLTITGAGSDNTFIDGNATDRVFQIMSGANATLSNITIRNGHVTNENGGGILINDGILAPGGIAYLTPPGNLSLNAITVSGNKVETTISGGGGGGIYNNGILTITNCIIDNNEVFNQTGSEGGGAIQNEGVSGIGPNLITTTIIGSTLSNNKAPIGAAIRNLFGRVSVDTSIVETNTAGTTGGGIENGSSGSMSINRSAIHDNIAPQNGGGIDNVGTMDIGSTTIYGNQALGCDGTSCTVGTGGAGAGVFNSGGGILNIFNTTISANSALIGGGLYNHNEVLSTNSTLFDNSATTGGSEVYACGNKDESTTPPLTCANGATGKDTTGKTVATIHTKFVNTIIGDSNGNSAGDNCFGVNLTPSAGDTVDLTAFPGGIVNLINSNGHNIETANTCGFTQSTDIRNASPSGLFSSGLVYNGGDVTALLTYAIKDTGPAHNAGDLASCPIIDERGFKRDEGDGLCDIGAYEISLTNTNFNVLDLTLDIQFQNAPPQNDAVQTTFTLSVDNKGPVAATNVVLTGKLPALPWLSITSLNAGSSGGTCTQTAAGFTCTVASIDAYKSVDFFAATLATAAGSFSLGGEVKSDEADNFRPDNLKSVTVTIPTLSGSGAGGNNFGGTSGGGSIDWLSLVALLPAARRRRRNASPV
jgi:Domain of unknown function DUF11